MSGAGSPDLARAATLPARWYHDPAVYEAERRAVFGREWLLLAQEGELTEPGACTAGVLAGWPVFAVRGSDGEVRAFHNVCRHRAGPIACEGASRNRVLRCRYHGWVYDDRGRLQATPGFGEAEDFRAEDHALFPLAVAVWRGLLFVNLGAEPAPLEEALGRLPALAAHLPLEAMRPRGPRISHRLRCNWKTYVENYLEGYHVPYLHPALHREIVTAEYRVEAAERVVTHHVPSRPRVEAPVYDGLWAWLAPNAAINFYGRGLSLERMLPTGPTSMVVEYLFLFHPDASAAEQEAAYAMCSQVTAEDVEICEAVQRNLEAGLYERGRLSPRHENGVHYFQNRLREALHREGLCDPAPAAGRDS